MDLLEIGFGHVFERGSFKHLELDEGLGLLGEKRELFEVMLLSAQVCCNPNLINGRPNFGLVGLPQPLELIILRVLRYSQVIKYC